MRLTKMRIKGKKLSKVMLQTICNHLDTRFARAGFITNVGILNSTSIKIGLHMKTFTLDVSKWDRNLQCNPYQVKLTTLPVWDQRVEFNNIVNAVLNKFKVSCNVKSGPYTIRQGLTCMDEYDWQYQKPSWVYQNEMKGYRIETVDEKQFLEERRIRRNREAAHKRNMKKQAENASLNVPTLNLVRS